MPFFVEMCKQMFTSTSAILKMYLPSTKIPTITAAAAIKSGTAIEHISKWKILPVVAAMRLLRKTKSNVVVTIEHGDGTDGPIFHRAFAFVVLVAQFFGIMPIYGLTKSLHGLEFRWLSVRLLYAICNIAGAFVMATFSVLQFIANGVMLDKAGTLSFYVLNVFGALQFIQIARCWGLIVKEWTFVEISMRNYDNSINLTRRVKILTSTIIGLALVEHLLFILNALTASKLCENFPKHPVETYFGVAFPAVFSLIRFSPSRAVLVEVANVLTTITWNFTDLFIILISYALAAKFQQIVKKLKNNKVVHNKFWKEIREDYNKLSRLCKVVDQHLSPLVVISYISNTFFICIQLYNSIRERVGFVESLYYFYSFGFLLGRTTAVTLYAAWINDESRRPLEFLHSVPSEYYCTEISRMIQQMNSAPIGISGSKYFFVTRRFLLKMVSTIVTFELMFLQFGPLIKTHQPVSNSSNECIR